MNEETIFAGALEQKTPAARAAFLDQACAGDAVLRARVESLLHSHDHAGSFLEAALAPTDAAAGPRSGTSHARIGPYKLLQPLGEGGMGAVYLAEQETPVRRRVALKIIKAGMDSAQVISRFEQERRALAMMDHPNIAKVLDAGTISIDRAATPGALPDGSRLNEGRPYFVMELVQGIPITKFCDREQLSPRERLELFIPVCQAVQHAHQKGIIHRDLKPSNVLVALYDGRPVPKVIDFGVAKATGQKLTEGTMFTEIGQIVGTLEYMAPEQAELNNLDIDTRADIYSLGVILYELLTGSPPFTRQQLKSAAHTEMLRMIREVEPPKPSTKLSSSDELPSIAALRKLEPKRLTKLVSGELDWIVMKCLEKDRGRRYETANGLAFEIARFLQDEPVLAGPPSVTYRLRKFLRRNNKAVVAVALVFIALIAGMAGMTWGLFEANDARKLAEQQRTKAETARADEAKQRRAAKSAEKAAEEQRNQAEAVASYLVEAFRSPDPTLDGREIKVAELLDRAADRLHHGFTGDEVTRARLLDALGETYRGLGLPAKAVELHDRARTIRHDVLGPDHSDTLTSMHNLAWAHQAAGSLAEALRLSEETLKLRQTKLGPDHPDTLHSMHKLVSAYKASGRLPEAVTLCEQTLKLRQIRLGQNHPDTLSSMYALASVLQASGRLPEAVELAERTLKLRKANLGPDHPDTLVSMSNLANVYLATGRLPEALPLFEETLKLQKVKLGSDHSETFTTVNNLAAAYLASNRLSEALPLLEETLQFRKTRLGPDHPRTLTSMNNLAAAYKDAGRFPEAVSLFEKTRELKQAKFGPDHPDTLTALANLAWAYQAAGRLPDALPLYEQALMLRKAKLSPDHPDTLIVKQNLVTAYLAAHQPDKAISLLGELLADRRKQFGPENPRLAAVLASLGFELLRHGQYESAENVLRECQRIREQKEPDDWRTFSTNSMLGGSLSGQKKFALAEPLLRAGYEGMKQREDKIPAQSKISLLESIQRLIDLYIAWEKPDQAAEWRAKLPPAEKAEATKP